MIVLILVAAVFVGGAIAYGYARAWSVGGREGAATWWRAFRRSMRS